MLSGWKSGFAACLFACTLLNRSWYSMASLMEAVASRALNLRAERFFQLPLW